MKNKHPEKPALLAIVKRGNTTETLHYGWICVLNKDKKIICKRGNVNNKTLLRSCAKPIQAIPLIENVININNKELAIVCGSHSGSNKHLKVLYGFIKKHKLYLSDLRCGIHMPYDVKENHRLIRKNLQAAALHNNCSGKHLGMLLVCRKKNWDLNTYLNSNHPLQKLIKRKIQELSETSDISLEIDGCSLPTFGLSILNIAKLFSNFTKNIEYKKIISAMAGNPDYMGSTGQIDTEIIKQSKGKLLAKVGAEGLIIVAFNGNCAAVKISDGSQKIRSFVILKLLLKLGWLKEKNIKNLFLKEILKGDVKNHRGITVGKIKSLI